MSPSLLRLNKTPVQLAVPQCAIHFHNKVGKRTKMPLDLPQLHDSDARAEVFRTEPDMLDETDLALIDALQVNPRASWSRLADALMLSPTTLARRWQRLSDAGEAWVSVVMGRRRRTTGALIEVSCRPGREHAVASALAEIPYVTTVGITTGQFQVYAIVLTPTCIRCRSSS